MTFDMSAAWRDATVMIRANREVLMIIAGIFFFLPGVATGFAVPAIPPATMSDPERAAAAIMAFYGTWGWFYAIVLVLQMVGTLALLALLRGQGRPTVGEAMRAGAVGLLPAIGTFLLIAFGFGLLVIVASMAIAALGTAAGGAGALVGALLALGLLVAIIVASVRLSLTTPIIAIDRVFNPLEVLQRSWRMTGGQAMRLFVFYLLLIVVYLVIVIVAGLLAGALLLALGELASVIASSLLSALIGAGAAVISVAVLAAVHRQLAGAPALNGDRATRN